LPILDSARLQISTTEAISFYTPAIKGPKPLV
jgi:hypothetical protein